MTLEDFVRRGQAAQAAVDTVLIDQLTIALRSWLHDQGAHGQIQASALAYELAAVIARHAPSVRAANVLIDTFALTMKDQIERCGIGVEHP
jgi:hypothetical protein